MFDAVFGQTAVALLLAVADAELEAGVVLLAAPAFRAHPRLARRLLAESRHPPLPRALRGAAAHPLQERPREKEQVIDHRRRDPRLDAPRTGDERPGEERARQDAEPLHLERQDEQQDLVVGEEGG